MAYSRTQIANLSTGQVGISIKIDDVDTENSAEAIACRTYLDHCISTLMEMVPWQFATVQINLQLSSTDPFPGWLYAYVYPATCARANLIVNPAQRTPQKTEDQIKFRVVKDPNSSGKLILTDQEEAILEMNEILTDVSLLSATFVQALQLFLATMIVMPLRVNPQIKADVNQAWALWLAEATNQSQRERTDDEQPTGEFVSGRG